MTIRTAGLLALTALLVRVPFDFRAGETPFGPGEYVLTLDAGAMTIRDTTLPARKSGEAGPRATSTVSFRTYGDSRFLAAIAIEGGARWEIAPSSHEATLTRTSGPPKVTHLKAEVFEER